MKPLAAGGVIYRSTSKGREYLLVTSRRGHRWVLPKGAIEIGETAKRAALREVREETGMVCAVVVSLGEVVLRKRVLRVVPTRFYLMRVKRKAKPKEQRRRTWCDAPSACERLSAAGARTAIRRAERHFAKRS